MGFRHSEPGHSIDDCETLIRMIEKWIKKGYEIDDFCIIESLTVLRYYFSIQNINDKEISDLYLRFKTIISVLPDYIINDIDTNSFAGIDVIPSGELVREYNNFSDFVVSRHSVRQFSNQTITVDELNNVIDLANKAPSACNRQPTRVIALLGKDKKKMIKNSFVTNKAFRDEFYGYLVVTVSRNLFYGHEQFQWYINGGIYLAYLTLALHSFGIGSCIMQWTSFDKHERQFKNELGIDSNDAVVAIIGIGKYDDESKVLKAQRINHERNLVVM